MRRCTSRPSTSTGSSSSASRSPREADPARLGPDGPRVVRLPRRPHARSGRSRSKAWNDRCDEQDAAAPSRGSASTPTTASGSSVDGDVSPCGLATEGELILGNLAEQDFDEIWNGPTARDLRRAHYTWDYPSLCKTCRFVDLAAAAGRRCRSSTELARATRAQTPDDVEPHARRREPGHMARQSEPPVIRLRAPDRESRAIRRSLLALGRRGRATVRRSIRSSPRRRRARSCSSWRCPPTLWERAAHEPRLLVGGVRARARTSRRSTALERRSAA